MATRNGRYTDGPLYRTDDGGASASTVVPSRDPTYAVAFASTVRSLAAGAFGNAEVSDDAGATWGAVGTRIAAAFNTLAAASPNVAYAGGEHGALVRTGDSGQNWSSVSPPTDAASISLAGVGPDRLYVLAADGSLQRSDNGGASYSLLNPGSFRARAIAAVDEDRLLLLGSGIALSKNAGGSFDRAGGPVAESSAPGRGCRGRSRLRVRRLRHLRLDRFRCSLAPRREAATQSDLRPRLHRQEQRLRARVRRVALEDHERRTALDAASGAWRARLLRWSSPHGSKGFVAIQGFGSVPACGVVLRTTDGGLSWRPQLVSPAPSLALDNSGSSRLLASR